MSRLCRRVWLMANFIAAALIVSGIDTAALADLRVCNQSSVRMDVSVGYSDPTLGWTSRGWFTLPAGSCGSVISGRLTSSAYYLYAIGEGGRVWEGNTARQLQGSAANAGVVGMKAPFCISKTKYTIPRKDHSNGNDLNCEAAGYESKWFVGFETGGMADYTAHFHSDQSSATPPPPTQAQPLPAPTVPRGETDPALLCSFLAREAYQACIGLIAGNPPGSTSAPTRQAQPLPVPTAPPGRPAPAGSACQRYPSLC
jgi:uncharacterized membrane protein